MAQAECNARSSMTEKQIAEIRARYPFSRYPFAPLFYVFGGKTRKARRTFVLIFDQLLERLRNLGTDASETERMEAFEEAVLALNALNEEYEGMIETDEREQLCTLFNVIAVATGIDPTKYGDGEGPASEWRDW
jgi:hypothetical protein